MHLAESILSAFELALTGLSTTGANVARGRAYAVPIFPALSIFKGSDVASDREDTLDVIVREMLVNVDIHIQATGNPETALNAIAAEVFAAVNLDYTLGLNYVFDCALVGDDEPEIEGSQDLPVARMRTSYLITYEHSKISAEL